MAWFGKVSLGGFQDLAGAVNKISESVKNIEKNFDSALGLEEKHEDEGASSTSSAPSAPGSWGSMPDPKGFLNFDPVMAFIGQKNDENTEESTKSRPESPPSTTEQSDDNTNNSNSNKISTETEIPPVLKEETTPTPVSPLKDEKEKEQEDQEMVKVKDQESVKDDSPTDDALLNEKVKQEEKEESEVIEESKVIAQDSVEGSESVANHVSDAREERETITNTDVGESESKVEREQDQRVEKAPTEHAERANEGEVKPEIESTVTTVEEHSTSVQSDDHNLTVEGVKEEEDTKEREPVQEEEEKQLEAKTVNSRDPAESGVEMEKLRKEMKMMEAALQGAARQAQAKADEIAKLMNENEQLKSIIEDLKRKSMENEMDSLKEEYQQRVASLERKVYALTKERDTLRREQSKKSDAAALLKEKDEIINQVMAEGEELSKKQAAQEATIRKLRAQTRELEEEKQRLNSKLQVEEAKVESIKRDKATTEKLLQETIEKNQAELAAQKEFYTSALNAAKEAEAVAEARANSEAKIELETKLREAGEKEAILIQNITDLRDTLSRKEQEAAYKEEMFKRDVDDIQKRYQASELRYNELVTQVPESTRPLLRQIEAMQETTARRAEAWAGVERALNSRLQEAEAKAAAAEENERSLNERLSQSLSRITVLETQITCLRTEQTQLSRSLEKERQRASESRQEYLAIKEEAATQEGRAKQLEEEIKELRIKHKKELHESATHRELLEQELERERAARAELERAASIDTQKAINQNLTRNMPMRKLSSSAGSLNSIEESVLLQASLDLTDNNTINNNNLLERRMSGESNLSSYFLKSMTPSAFEAALRQKDGELASYMSRLASLESIRDSLAEELVKMTEQCEKLKVEAATLPGVRAELDALRQRHTAALELMGERDEELEELRADIVDLKEMYREQVDLLVNKIQVLGLSV